MRTTPLPGNGNESHLALRRKEKARREAGLSLCCFEPMDQFWTFSSVRRLRARPSGLSEPSGLVFGAIGRLSPTFCTQDGVVPRTKLPHILRTIIEIGAHYGLRIANVFHAGDGNIHPILLFDERDPEQVRAVLEASHEILDECIACGGSVTGEHGIGVEKMSFMPKLFTADDLAAMVKVREVFNPEGRCSPEKMLPGGGGCIERKTPGHRASA